MTTIILIRHCEAEGNTLGVFQGSTDCGVSGSGEKQLDLLSVRCRNLHLDAVYSSPLKRAYVTAQAANRFHGLPIRTDERLMEIHGGDCEGLPFDELPRLYPSQNRAWLQAPWRYEAPNGETMRQVYDRAWAALTDIVQENPNKTVAVVSHGCTIRNMLCRALGKPLEELNDVDWCDNTALSILEFEKADALPSVSLLNDASHLTPEVSVFMHQTWWKKENLCE